MSGGKGIPYTRSHGHLLLSLKLEFLIIKTSSLLLSSMLTIFTLSKIPFPESISILCLRLGDIILVT